MSITLSHSYGTVTISNPEIGDSRDYRDYVSHNTLNDQTETTFKRVDDLYNIIYHFTFTTLSDTIRASLYDFCVNTAGLRITLIDHLGVEHLGYIISDVQNYVDNGTDDNSVNIDFMDITDEDGLDNSEIGEVALTGCELTVTEPTTTALYYLLQEDGTEILQEDNSEILTENAP